MGRIHILIAEDDEHIRAGLTDALESEGYRVTAASDGDEALRLFSKEEFQLVILDIMMPGKSGYDVCRAVRAKNAYMPIIMLTAKGEEIDKVIGLELGADDYITKPFGVRELLARIAAVLRRVNQNKTGAANADRQIPDRFSFGRAEIDARQFRGRLGDRSFDLSGREMRLLLYFHSHPKEVLSRDRLLNAVWGMDYFGTTRTLDQHVAQLRKKIEPNPRNPEVIKTVHGVGYRYEN